MRIEEEFTLQDREGNEHEYQVRAHPSKTGSVLMLNLCSLLSEPALHVVRLFVGEMEEGKSAGEVDLQKILDDADFDSLGASLRTALSELGPDDLHAFFKHTYRDGEQLASSGAYDKAYQGNWGEWMRAIMRIIKVNGFMDFLSSMLGK